MKSFCAIALLAAIAISTPDAFAANRPAATAPSKSDPIAAANAVLNDMDAGRYDAVYARFSPEMAAAVDAGQLKTVWMSMPLQFGKFQHRGAARVENAKGTTVVVIPLVYEHLTLEALVATDANGRIAGFLVRPAPPPPPAARADLTARDVQFGPTHRTELPGTLLLPKGKGPFPAVVLVHGSGPSDRDETVGGTRVFRDIAEGLADRGIASLRYEKRTRQHPAEFSNAYTVDDETTNDAVAAVAFLKAQPGIDPKRIYLVGHSQGAMMAPRIAQRAPGLAGIALLAAPARHLQFLVLDQLIYLSKNDPSQGPAIVPQIPGLRNKIDELNHINPRLNASAPLLNKLPASYWRDLAGYNQLAVAKSLKLPILVEQGERDFQVTAPDWAGWKTTFDGDARVTLRRYPRLNHLFVAGEGISLPSEYARPAHVDNQPIADIADWIKAH
jgi:dienelactone hydrolase